MNKFKPLKKLINSICICFFKWRMNRKMRNEKYELLEGLGVDPFTQAMNMNKDIKYKVKYDYTDDIDYRDLNLRSK